MVPISISSLQIVYSTSKIIWTACYHVKKDQEKYHNYDKSNTSDKTPFKGILKYIILVWLYDRL